MVEIRAVGGYGEIGRNMTLVRVGNESVLLDMGIHLDRLLDYTKDEEIGLADIPVQELMDQQVIPDDRGVDKKEVKAIILSHGHLDHIAAVPFMERNYHCPIMCTPYTAEVLDRQFKDNRFKQHNQIKKLGYNQKVQISKNIAVEFIRVTHSIPQSAIVVLHTSEGIVVYANDFKLDMTPVLGKPSDLEALKGLNGKVKVLISECLRAKHPGKTASEKEAARMLEETMLGEETSRAMIFVTSFSSHIERLHTVVKLAKRMKRKVVFLGRSLEKYASAARLAKISSLIDEVEVIKYRSQVKRRLSQLAKEKSDKIVVLTGHQAERAAVLSNIVEGVLPSPFRKGDVFIFSCNIIPTPKIEEARAAMEEKMKKYGMRIYKDLHVSGHASRDDLLQMIELLNPEVIIPAHGELRMMDDYEKLAKTVNKKVVKIVTGESANF